MAVTQIDALGQDNSASTARGRPNAAIQYQSDSYDAARQNVMGRHAAGAGFFKGLVEHGDLPAFYAFTASKPDFDHFAQRIQGFGRGNRPVHWVQPGRFSLLREAGCLYLAGPGLGEEAWRRRFSGERNYSLCGVTHTVCSDRALDALGDLLTAPTQSWDAVVCTSKAVKVAVRRLLDEYASYLEQRVGDRPPQPFQLPIIPLGVDAEAYAPSGESTALRKKLRQELNISDADIALLFFGRLSFHAKAHPVPMFLAAEKAQRALLSRPSATNLHFINIGQFANDSIRGEFEAAAMRYCPNVRVHFLDGANADLSRSAWASGDIFMSLSDNIQESFGLTPIEAMAAGLPCIVSDWNGYRDTIVDGETGFLIPTVIPPNQSAGDMIQRYALGSETYDRYVGAVSQATAVDVVAAAQAIERLASTIDLRRSLGEAGRRRARELFDWRVVIAQYQDLWGELSQRRRQDGIIAPAGDKRSPHALRPDPFYMFKGHATATLKATQILRLADSEALERLDAVLSQSMNTFTAHFMIPPGNIRRLATSLKERPQGIGELVSGRSLAERRLILRTVAWLLKYHIVES